MAADSAAFVIDAATVAKWGFDEAGTPSALRLFDAWVEHRIHLMAPDTLVPELGSVCRRKARAGEVTPAHALAVHEALQRVLPPLVPTEDVAESALLLATRHDRPFAEAVHLALAIRESATYVTADERVLRLLAPTFGCVRHLADLALG